MITWRCIYVAIVYISEMWKIVEAIAENADTAQWEILNKTQIV